MTAPAAQWACGEVRAITDKGMLPFPGWIRGNFGLDFRCMWSEREEYPNGIVGWTVTHLPTGRAIFALVMPLAEAQHLVDEIEAYTDWSAIDLDNGVFLKPRFKELRDRLGVRVVGSAEMIPPWAYSNLAPRDGGGTHLRLVK